MSKLLRKLQKGNKGKKQGRKSEKAKWIDFDEDDYDSLLAEIRKIRLFERRFYQKVTDIYVTIVDYDSKSPTAIKFFKKI